MASGAAPSLVKYDTAELVSGKTKKSTSSVPKLSRRTALPATEELLNAILPPREWTQDGQHRIQRVSSTPATRLDVINLQEQLDLRLQQRQARETGICPIREELYGQCFGIDADELIRQVTVNCAERGLLLLAVRNEIRMTVAAYQSLYESSIAFGMRKALLAEQRRSELQAKIKLLTAEVTELEKTMETLTTKCEELESTEKERFAAEEEKHSTEVAKLRQMNDQLKESLESLLAPPSAASKK